MLGKLTMHHYNKEAIRNANGVYFLLATAYMDNIDVTIETLFRLAYNNTFNQQLIAQYANIPILVALMETNDLIFRINLTKTLCDLATDNIDQTAIGKTNAIQILLQQMESTNKTLNSVTLTAIIQLSYDNALNQEIICSYASVDVLGKLATSEIHSGITSDMPCVKKLAHKKLFEIAENDQTKHMAILTLANFDLLLTLIKTKLPVLRKSALDKIMENIANSPTAFQTLIEVRINELLLLFNSLKNGIEDIECKKTIISIMTIIANRIKNRKAIDQTDSNIAVINFCTLFLSKAKNTALRTREHTTLLKPILELFNLFVENNTTILLEEKRLELLLSLMASSMPNIKVTIANILGNFLQNNSSNKKNFCKLFNMKVLMNMIDYSNLETKKALMQTNFELLKQNVDQTKSMSVAESNFLLKLAQSQNEIPVRILAIAMLFFCFPDSAKKQKILSDIGGIQSFATLSRDSSFSTYLLEGILKNNEWALVLRNTLDNKNILAGLLSFINNPDTIIQSNALAFLLSRTYDSTATDKLVASNHFPYFLGLLKNSDKETSQQVLLFLKNIFLARVGRNLSRQTFSDEALVIVISLLIEKDEKLAELGKIILSRLKSSSSKKVEMADVYNVLGIYACSSNLVIKKAIVDPINETVV